MSNATRTNIAATPNDDRQGIEMVETGFPFSRHARRSVGKPANACIKKDQIETLPPAPKYTATFLTGLLEPGEAVMGGTPPFAISLQRVTMGWP